MPESTNNAVVAIYIGSNGEILASEQIQAPREIVGNQLRTLPGPSSETEILEVEIRVAYKTVADGCCTQTRNEIMARVCYDKFGRRVPCVGWR